MYLHQWLRTAPRRRQRRKMSLQRSTAHSGRSAARRRLAPMTRVTPTAPTASAINMSDTDRPVVGSVTPPPAMEVVGGRGEIASVVVAADVVVGGRLVVDVVVGGSVVVD